MAALLEAARALKASPPLANDLIFLFTDGEELGLGGAHAFVQNYPDLKNIGLVLNLEARGNSGPSLTFEVSSGNNLLMREYIKAVPVPQAGSLMYEIYKKLPNDTDFTVFKNAGIPGFNCAFIGGLANYHNMTDTVENLDKGSLQHHGSYVVAIARHFGNLPLDNLKSGDAVYFNLVGSRIIRYPAGLNIWLVLLAILATIAYWVLGIKTERLCLKIMVMGFLLYLAVAAVIVAVGWFFQEAIYIIYPQYGDALYHENYYYAAIAALAVAAFSIAYAFVFKRLQVENLFAGFLPVGLLLMIVVYIIAPTAVYPFLLPLLLAPAGGAFCFWYKLSPQNKPWLYAVIRLAVVIPFIMVSVPMFFSAMQAFGLKLAFVGVFLLSHMLGFLIPQVYAAFSIHRRFLPVVAMIIVVAALIGGHLDSFPSDQQPLHTNLMYCLQADAPANQKAFWASYDANRNEANSQYFPQGKKESFTAMYPFFKKKNHFLLNRAPEIDLPEPTLTMLADRRIEKSGNNESVRELQCNLSSTGDWAIARVFINKKARIRSLEVDGKSIDLTGTLLAASAREKKEPGEYISFYYFGYAREGIDIALECATGQPVEIILFEMKWGIPSFPSDRLWPSYYVHDTDMLGNIVMHKKRFFCR